MDPFTFLKEECGSVRAALNETLRHDYGPARSRDYFNECKKRLDDIQQAIADEPQMDRATIADRLRSLAALGSRISLIERSHLGEFSWPFAEAIRKIAEKLFVEQQLDDTPLAPIVHVIAEGMHYQIVDDVLPLVGDRRIVIVAFPRQLKHHVLLHSIFGHELGHTAIKATGPGEIIATEVMPALINGGPLQDSVQATAWLRKSDAPSQIRALLEARDSAYRMSEVELKNWRTEIICDLFGLLLFGPAFAAAHRTIIGTLCDDPWKYDLGNSTHPPYLIRRRVIASAIRELRWDRPITIPDDGLAHEAEKAMLYYATEDGNDVWTSSLFGNRLPKVLELILKVFAVHPESAYKPARREVVLELIKRLTFCRPPIVHGIEVDGTPKNTVVPTAHILYAGWCFWFGREQLRRAELQRSPRLRELSFLQINQLCDFALLQQCAISACSQPVQQ